ncbi:mycofactocin-coupled SDR family oxidoreductase [Rhodococcus sp. NPDC058505]|uniref:mycofactocin-coupled SDR family oxidoreductase n=1 Tax=unclassified Rhodococcus (in: high G+C Gram-positive bacteria) TaxID=192944 RepID=UPI00365A63DE
MAALPQVTGTRMAGRVALITGAARGMGRSHAIRLAQEGADLLCLDLPGRAGETNADLAETAETVRSLGRRAVESTADVTDPDALCAVVERGVEELGRLDVLVANAGIYANTGPTWTLDPTAWRTMLDVNVTGVWHSVKAAAPHMRDGGAIVVIASTAAIRAVPGAGHYSASKHAVIGLARNLANELGPRSIRVNTVLPGSVSTSMIMNEETFARMCPDVENPTDEDLADRFRANHLLPVPWVDPVDISNAVLYLASDEARYVTGTEIVVDAGLTQKVS